MNVLLALGLLLAPPEPADASIETILSRMTLEQKVGQLMMIGFGGRQMGPEIARLLLAHHVGAVALYSRNIQNTEQLSRLVRDLRTAMRGEVQPFVGLDQEGGNVVRVRSDVTVLPGAMVLGATGDPVLAFLAGQASAIDLGLVGIDLNLAPVLDVNRNPKNPVINIRAFGDQPELVSNLGVAYIQGQQQAGMATVAKHFPGHGTTSQDSHFALPIIPLAIDELEANELLPFRRAIDVGLDAVMTAHVRVPAVDPTGTPAPLSHRVITGLLRNELGFDGLVITDDLEMDAISARMEVGEAAVRSVLAGADMVMVIWTREKKRQVFEGLLAAARSGRITPARLEQSVRRILRLKARRGTLDALDRPPMNPAALLPNPLHDRLVQVIANRGVTLVRDERSLLPLCDGHGVVVASPYRPFEDELKRALPEITVSPLELVPSQRRRQLELERLTALAGKERLLIVAVANAYQAWLVQKLQRRIRTPIVAVSFGSPYYLRNFLSVSAYLCTFSYLPSSQIAAARALSGRIPITGRLPVSIMENVPRGHGLILSEPGCQAAAAVR